MIVSDGLVEQHIHGAFGIDFMTCSLKELVSVSQEFVNYGVTSYFPTVMTDDIDVIRDRIRTIEEAKKSLKPNSANIEGIHLEGPFISKEKAGIHQKEFILPLEVDLFKQIESNEIKIVTLAPELDYDNSFINYLKSKNIKISAGHCNGPDLSMADQVTHLYNAMGSFNHRSPSTTVSALSNDNLYTEIIADSIHVSDEVLKITFKLKNSDKILLISDALPLAHSDKKECTFAGQEIFNKSGRLVNNEGVFAGSSLLLCDIVKNLADKNILKLKDALQMASSNQLKYHNIKNNLKVFWNDSNEIVKVDFIKIN